MHPIFHSVFISLLLTAGLLGCSKSAPSDKFDKKDKPVLLLHALDLVSVSERSFALGPMITGSIQAEKLADVRAEVSAPVVQVLIGNGDKVRRGDVLVRLDDTAIKEALLSAQEAVRTAELSLEQAERQLKRLKTLETAGMVTAQQMEDAEVKRNSARSELLAAKSREAQAKQQLSRTISRAPFDGVVSERKVSPGDTAQVGKELLKLIDTKSLRFEGMVAAESINQIKIGQAVEFKVNGYAQRVFQGEVQRIHPVASSSTRQVAVMVSLGQGQQPSLTGLYAEGRVLSQAQVVSVMPASALKREGDQAFAWCIKDEVLHKMAVTLGRLDQAGSAQEIVSGLSLGDTCIRYPTAELSEGQTIARESPMPMKAKAKP